MRTSTEGIANRLTESRQRRSIAAADLARMAGVTRQTIYAIEAGSFVPNTAVALRLARALDVPVEELFRLEDDPAAQPLAVEPLSQALLPGQPVTLCKVGRATVAVPSSPVPAYLPSADAILAKRNRADLFRPSPLPDRILIAGCDPALSVLAAHARAAGVEVVLANCSSSRALDLLKQGKIHIAGTHLPGEIPVRRTGSRKNTRIVTFAAWQQGFVVARGNPKGIREAGDLARADVEIVNREPGAGSRMLLDRELTRAGVKAKKVRGYGRLAAGHLPAAWQVANGLADCCVATEVSARAFGLHFIPLDVERFDLVTTRNSADSGTVIRQLDTLLDTMQDSALRRELQLLAGYDTSQTGHTVA